MNPGQYQNLINTHEKLKIKDRLTVIQPVFNSAPRRKNDTEASETVAYVCMADCVIDKTPNIAIGGS